MSKKLCLLILLALLMGTLNLATRVEKAEVSGTVYIRADGTIEPSDAPISSIDNVTYTLTGNITSDADGIVVEKDNIVLDGMGYTVQGNGSETGVSLRIGSDVTVKNIQITGFMGGINSGRSNIRIQGSKIAANYYGIFISADARSNSIYGNNTIYNSYGIMLSEAWGHSVFENNIENNTYGVEIIRFGGNSIYHNNFVNNTGQVDVITCINSWDIGYPSGGNYWSDYNGTDANHDGIGDTSYVIDTNNIDHYPLMTQYIIPEFPSFLVLPTFMVVTLLAAIFCRRKHAT